MAIDAWLRLPVTLLGRLNRDKPPTPWMVPAATEYLSTLIERPWCILELGAGGSTVWLAKRVRRVVSFESDSRWYEQIRGQLEGYGLANFEIRLVPLELFPREIRKLPAKSFDLVVVDEAERDRGERMVCLSAAAPLVRAGGYLVLDDSDRAEYGMADRLLEGWAVRRFVGLKRFPFAASETSIYRNTRDS